ncbi:MAG: hypothetical protein P4L45_03825 [Ignavibacteriaceae bacterium]|nr:hypothetical protein [Ignavibacteriaceae bacterium]
MKSLKLLIVDDDDSQIQLLQDQIKEKNKDLQKDHIEIVTEVCKNKDDAILKVSNQNYNAAVIDLKLSSDKTKTDGNDVIKEIRNKMRFPIIVLSNFPQNLDQELSMETDVFKIKERTSTKSSDIIDEIVEFYYSGIDELFGKDGKLLEQINSSLHELFWERIANNWEYLVQKITDPMIRLKVIEKQLIIILKEKMEIGDLGFDKSEPFEMYIIPPIRKHYYTGDIILKDDTHFIILSPACDMEIRKGDKPEIENVVIGKLSQIKDHSYTKSCWKDGSFQDSKEGLVENLIRSKKGDYHLLPPFRDKMGFILDFSNVSSVPYNNLVNYKRIATVTEPYLKNIISRFSNYFNRLGQPDFDNVKLMQEIKAL